MSGIESFYDEQLLPTYRDWRADPTLDHRAKLLAQAANNMAERFAHHYGYNQEDKPRRPSDYRNLLRQDCPEFGLIWDLADNAKHIFLGRTNAAMSHIDQAAMSKSIDHWGKVDDVKNWDNHQVLILTDNNGTQHKFEVLIEAVMAKFRELMAREGMVV